ncbi:FAS-associated factor 2 [Thoreauomyces humboldtii]|nr:FAS-associated factor 2 [Thoreauomyces humboldtii]
MDILHTLTPEQQETLQTYQAITNDDDLDAAVSILETHGWDLQATVTSLYETGPTGQDFDEATVEDAVPPPGAPADVGAEGPVNLAPRSLSLWSLLTLPVTLPLNIVWILFQYAASFLPASLRRAITRTAPYQRRRRVSDSRDPRAAAARFVLDFEQTFGTVHPDFFQGTYAQALQKAKTEVRYLIAYLHSVEHDDTEAFCRGTLCTPSLGPTLTQRNVLFWAGDVANTEAFQVSNVLGASRYPFLAVIAPHQTRLAIVARIEGRCTADVILNAVNTVVEQMDPEIASLRAERQQREQTRMIREQQDEAYQASLRADKEKVQPYDPMFHPIQEVGFNCRSHLHLTWQQLKAQEEARLLAETELAAQAVLAQRATLLSERAARKQHLISTLASEPPKSATTTALSIRLPSGDRVVRRFEGDDTVERVREFVETQDLEGLDGGEDFVIVGMYPRKVYADGTRTLREVGLCPSGSLVVEEKIDD